MGIPTDSQGKPTTVRSARGKYDACTMNSGGHSIVRNLMCLKYPKARSNVRRQQHCKARSVIPHRPPLQVRDNVLSSRCALRTGFCRTSHGRKWLLFSLLLLIPGTYTQTDTLTCPLVFLKSLLTIAFESIFQN